MSDLPERPGHDVGRSHTLVTMAPCIDSEGEWEVLWFYQVSGPVLEGGGPADLPECTLDVLAVARKMRFYPNHVMNS